jgi:enolase-phosphatase E1
LALPTYPLEKDLNKVVELKILNRVDAVILDIEGTTTPIDFVHRTLFQFAKQNMHNFLKENINSEGVRKAIRELRSIYNEIQGNLTGIDSGNTVDDKGSIENDASILNHLIDIDSKATQLKLIEGMIWEEGYKDGRLRGEVYADVPIYMKKWTSLGKKIYIYSSGSVLAQRLIFSSTKYGDLTAYITNYFDTEIGRKTDPESYGKIAERIGINPQRILFISDSMGELKAAASRGFQTLMILRDGNSEKSEYPSTIEDFSEIE